MKFTSTLLVSLLLFSLCACTSSPPPPSSKNTEVQNTTETQLSASSGERNAETSNVSEVTNSVPSATSQDPPFPNDLEGNPITDRTCPNFTLSSLHCSLEGSDPRAIQTISCCNIMCMDPITQPSESVIQQISLRQEGAETTLPIQVSTSQDGACLRIQSEQVLDAGTHVKLSLPRFGLRTSKGDVPTFNNALETLGAWNVCFNPNEDLSARRKRTNTRNACRAQRDLIAARPAFLDNTASMVVRRSYATRTDNYSDITRFEREAFDTTTRVPAAELAPMSRPPVLTMTFRDTTGADLGKGSLRCDGWLCLEDPKEPQTASCYRAHAPTINAFFRLEARGCGL